jgi:hypothetical protein
VPEERCRVEISVIAVVSIRPGMRTITPASVAMKTEIGKPAVAMTAASSDAVSAATGSKTRLSPCTREVSSERRPITRPMPNPATISCQPPPRKRAELPEATAKAAVVSQTG